MKEYTITKKAENFSWDQVPKLTICEPLEQVEVTIQAWAQICYDEEALHVRLSSDEIDIRAELSGPLDEVCSDSCLEFFFSPVEGDRRYFNIESNLNAAIYLGIGSNAHNLVRLFPEEPSIKPCAKKTEEGWEVSYCIPYEFIRRFFPEFKVYSGKEIRANCFKCADMTEPPHYLTWNPHPLLEYASFHNPDAFGLMKFE